MRNEDRDLSLLRRVQRVVPSGRLWNPAAVVYRCEARWDDRRHLSEQPLRTERGKPSKPYHDVQAYLAGTDTARVLQDLFLERWKRSGGEPPHLSTAAGPDVAER